MRTLFVVLSALGVIGLAFWTYRGNYATQQALREVSELRLAIADLREELGVLRAEWAYLNRPDRLRELAGINFDRLGLLEFQPHQFGRVDELPFPGDAPEGWPEPLGGVLEVVGVLEAAR